MKIENIFNRNYTARKNETQDIDPYYRYLSSEEDIIDVALKKRCIFLGNNQFFWYGAEGKSITHISVLDLGLPLKQTYTRYIRIQTVGVDNHPEGLLRLLETHGFTEQQTKPPEASMDRTSD